jgi:hypothetical protein
LVCISVHGNITSWFRRIDQSVQFSLLNWYKRTHLSTFTDDTKPWIRWLWSKLACTPIIRIQYSALNVNLQLISVAIVHRDGNWKFNYGARIPVAGCKDTKISVSLMLVTRGKFNWPERRLIISVGTEVSTWGTHL